MSKKMENEMESGMVYIFPGKKCLPKHAGDHVMISGIVRKHWALSSLGLGSEGQGSCTTLGSRS